MTRAASTKLTLASLGALLLGLGIGGYAFGTGMRDRGRIRIGAFADLTVFDSAAVSDRATYERAAQFSEGIRHVVVNGVAVVRDGEVVAGQAPGRPIRAALGRP